MQGVVEIPPALIKCCRYFSGVDQKHFTCRNIPQGGINQAGIFRNSNIEVPKLFTILTVYLKQSIEEPKKLFISEITQNQTETVL
jgi:hypothetical protein